MKQKRKWFFLILIFIVCLIAVSGVFVLRRGSVSEAPAAAAAQTAAPSPSSSPGAPAPAVKAPVESALNDIGITPYKYNDRGVSLDSPFLIKTKTRLSLDQLKNSISIKTGESFVINESADTAGAYEMKFNGLLDANRIYNIIFSPEGKQPVSFAFQTAPGFAAPSPAPENENAGGNGVAKNGAGAPDSLAHDISLYGDVYENFLPNEDIIIRYLLSERYKSQVFSVGVYAFSDPAVFADYYTRNKNTVSGSLKQLENSTAALYVPNNSATAPFDAYLSLNTLPEGYYLVHVSAGDISVNKLVQVNRLSVYSLSVGGDMCFWVNDTFTGAPAIGAAINKQSARTVTDSDGKAMMRVNAAESSPITIQYRDAPVFAYTGLSFKAPETSLNEKYYHYIYTDRDEYHANDAVNVFGVIREVNANYRLNPWDIVTVSLGGMESAPVQTDKYGCFSHTFNVTGMSGSAPVSVQINGEELMSAPVSFAGYNKDKFLINADTDRHVYFTDEKPAVNLSVTTYDGAPAPGVVLELNTSAHPSGARTVTTDADGTASGSLTLRGGSSQAPYLNAALIAVNGIEDYYQTYSAPFITLNTDTMLEYKKMPDNTISFTSSSVDRDAMEKAFDTGNADPYSPDVYRGNPVNLDFTMAIKEVTLLKIKTGEHYDYILNQSIPEYRFSTTERVLETRALSAENGALTLTGLPKSTDPNISYVGDVLYKDSKNRTVKFSVDLSGEINIPSDYYSFELQKDSNMMKLGESSVIRLNGETAGQGRVLAVLTNNGILSASVTAPDNIPVMFSRDCMYSVQVFGAYFDGKHAIPVARPLGIRFDPSDQKLNVTVKPDKDQYKPGDEPLLQITVTDQKGQPRQAAVNVSIADDAAFTAGAHSNLDFLDELYGSTAKHRSDYNVYTSYGGASADVTESPGDTADAGGLSQKNIRKDSKDNPVFETVETDIHGKAELSVKLTDAAARWRVSSHAVSTDYCAGSDQTYIAASLPFYTDLALADEFVSGDHEQFTVKPYGTAYVFGKSPVSYAYELKKGDETILTGNDSRSGADTFDLGVLDTGEYTLGVSAVLGTYADNNETYSYAVERTFRVMNSGVRLNLLAVKTLTADQPQMPAIVPVESPVNILLYNADYSYVFQIFNEVRRGTPIRADYIAASAFAADYLGGDDKLTRLLGVKNKIIWNNGIPEQAYGSGNPIYTARFAAAFPELIDKNAVKAYVNNTLGMYVNNMPAPPSNDNAFEINRAAGYFLQAAVKNSVLYEIDAQVKGLANAKDDGSLKLRKLLYAAAYCAIGADDRAASVFDPNTRYSENQELANALTFYINTSLNQTAAIEYLQARDQNTYVSDICERINYIRKSKPLDDSVSEAVLQLDGKAESIALRGYDMYAKSITLESYKGMLLKPVSGSISLNISYNGRPSDFTATQNIIGLEKSIYPVNGVNNMYDVVFNANMPQDAQAGYYAIRDRVPGSMRFAQTAVTDDSYNVSYLEKQLVDISFYYDGKTQPGDIRYRVIKVSPAGAVIERAYISRDFIIDHPWGASKPLTW